MILLFGISFVTNVTASFAIYRQTIAQNGKIIVNVCTNRRMGTTH